MSLAEMPNAMPQASPGELRVAANPHLDPDFLMLEDDQKVDVLYFDGWEVSRIARVLGMRRDQVQQHCDEIDGDMEAALEDAPEAIKKRHSRMLRSIAANVMASRAAKENPKLLLISIKAMADERKMLGLDAPVKTANLTVTAHTMAQPRDMQELLRNERFREALLICEREMAGRQLTQGDLAGQVRGDRVSRDLEEGQAP